MALAASLARREDRPAELPEGPESGLEPGRPRAFQPGREPPRRRCAVRLHGDLHDAAFGAGARAASAARPGAARIRRRGQSRQAAVAAAAGAARRRDLRVAAADGRRRRDLPSAALDAARGVTLAWQRARSGKRRRRGAHAGGVARQPSAAPAGDRHRRRAQALGARPGGRAGFPHGGHAGRRGAERRRRSRRCSPAPTRWCCCAANGWRSIANGCERTIQQFREAEQLAAREGLAFAEAMRMLAGAAVADDAAAMRDRRLVAAWRPGHGWRKRCKGCARPTARAPIPAGVARHAAAVSAASACSGCICCRGSAWARASPTTWDWARRSRCWRCCWCAAGGARRRACWWRRRRCWPTGRRRSRSSRPA